MPAPNLDKTHQSSEGKKSKKQSAIEQTKSKSKGCNQLIHLLNQSLGDNLASKYKEVADQFNTQEKTSIAVPLYRQAILLLIEERDSLKDEIQVCSNKRSKGEGLTSHSEESNSCDSSELNSTNAALAECTRKALKSQLISLADNLSSESAQKLLKSIEHLEEELHQLPIELHLFCCKAYLLINDANKATTALNKADLNDPIAKGLARELFNRHLALKLPRQALYILNQLSQHSDNTDDTDQGLLLLNQLVEVEAKAGKANKAAQYWADLTAIAPEKIDLKKLLDNAKQWLEKGETEAALTLLMALNAMFGRQPLLMELLASSHESMGNYEAAAMVYREIIQPHYVAR